MRWCKWSSCFLVVGCVGLMPARAQSPADDGGFTDESKPLSEPTGSRGEDLFAEMDRLSQPLEGVNKAPKPSEDVKSRVERCFQSSHERDASYRGRVEVQVTVTAGHVSAIELRENETGDPLVGSCLNETLKGVSIADQADGAFAWAFTMNPA